MSIRAPSLSSPADSEGSEKSRMSEPMLRPHTGGSKRKALQEEMQPIKKMKKKRNKHEECAPHHETLVPCTKRIASQEEAPPMKKSKKMKKKGIPAKVVEGCLLSADIIEDILARLPAKSLGKFSCACKLWQSMLSSNHFVDLHIGHANSSSTKFLLVKMTHRGATLYLSDFGHFEKPILQLRGSEFCEASVHLLSKPCRGLNLLYAIHPYFSVCVFNPCTREFMELPHGNQCIIAQNVGMGFHRGSNEYKVLRLFYLNRDFESRKYSMGCEVYTLGTSCRWRSAQEPPYPVTDLPPVFVNGALHWMIEARLSPASFKAVLCFNLGDESFRVLALPSSCLNVTDSHDAMHIVELEDCLCLANGICSEGTMDIWMLEGYDTGVWKRVYHIDLRNLLKHSPEPEYVFPLKIHNGKVLLQAERVAYIYDPSSDAIDEFLTSKNLPSMLPAINDGCRPFYRYGLYEESLVPIGQTHEEILISDNKNKALMEIFSRLPVRSIGRFKCVCMSWWSLISSDYFTELHLEQSVKTKRWNIFLACNENEFIPLEKMGPHIAEEKISGWEEWSLAVFSKPCHGLNIMSSTSWIHIYNPNLNLTYEVLRGTKCKCPRTKYNHGICRNHVGFVFDSNRKEHILVRPYYQWSNVKNRFYSMSCEIYRLGTYLFWLRIDADPPCPISEMPPASVDGALYWMSEPRLCRRSSPPVILAFEPVSRSFRVMPAPSCCSRLSWSGRRIFLVELKGHLCMVHVKRKRDRMDIWMLRHGVWAREYKVCLENWPSYSLRQKMVIPMEIEEDGRILLSTGERLGYYDIESRAIQTIYSQKKYYFGNERKRSGFIPVVIVMESLVEGMRRRCQRVW